MMSIINECCHILTICVALEDYECELISVCEPFVKDWKSSSRAFRALWEAIGDARFELLRRREHQRTGIAAARTRGVHMRRQKKK